MNKQIKILFCSLIGLLSLCSCSKGNGFTHKSTSEYIEILANQNKNYKKKFQDHFYVVPFSNQNVIAFDSYSHSFIRKETTYLYLDGAFHYFDDDFRLVSNESLMPYYYPSDSEEIKYEAAFLKAFYSINVNVEATYYDSNNKIINNCNASFCNGKSKYSYFDGRTINYEHKGNYILKSYEDGTEEELDPIEYSSLISSYNISKPLANYGNMLSKLDFIEYKDGTYYIDDVLLTDTSLNNDCYMIGDYEFSFDQFTRITFIKLSVDVYSSIGNDEVGKVDSFCIYNRYKNFGEVVL